MTTAEPDRSPVRVAHLALGGGQLVVVYIRGARVEVPIYPADEGAAGGIWQARVRHL